VPSAPTHQNVVTLPKTTMTLIFTYTIIVLELNVLLTIHTLHLVGAQTASTVNLFNTFGQGSFPKLLFATVTVHLDFPIHF